MDLGERLSRWWERVRGLDGEGPTARPPQTRPRRPAPQGARRVAPLELPPAAHGSLKLSVEDAPPAANAAARPGAAGFDPYASDGGFAKPHGWDQVDRK